MCVSDTFYMVVCVMKQRIDRYENVPLILDLIPRFIFFSYFLFA